MLEAFAGPPVPLLSPTQRRRRATRRTLVVFAVVLAVLVTVPVGWALLSRLWETPTQFLNDRGQPLHAKQMIHIEQMLERVRGARMGEAYTVPRLRAIETLIAAPTPKGEEYVYRLHFRGGRIGYFFSGPGRPAPLGLNSLSLGTAYAGISLAPTCGRGWALLYIDGRGNSLRRFRTEGYVFGRVVPKVESVHVLYPHADQVASIHVLYPDGSTSPGTVANGFYFVSLRPSAPTTINLVSTNRAGQTVGRVVVDGYGGSPYPIKQPWPVFICFRSNGRP
jgi:hypothetical protein